MLIEKTALHLTTGGTSLVVDVGDGRLPRILHWGEPLGDLTTADLAAISIAARPANRRQPCHVPATGARAASAG